MNNDVKWGGRYRVLAYSSRIGIGTNTKDWSFFTEAEARAFAKKEKAARGTYRVLIWVYDLESRRYDTLLEYDTRND